MSTNKTHAQNPMSEYLLKLQLIVSNTEFKNREEASKYETLDSRFAGEAYIAAVYKKDNFNSYEHDKRQLFNILMKEGYSSERIAYLIENPIAIPTNVQSKILEIDRVNRIKKYVETNPYYVTLTGEPFQGDENRLPDKEVPIPDEFYEMYQDEQGISKGQMVHKLPTRCKELLINSPYYDKLIEENRDCKYLRFIGSNSIPIYIARQAKDGDIMKINTDKLSTYHPIFGHIKVEPEIIHQFIETYHKIRKYIYGTLRGEFSAIYDNYNSFIRFLTIYMTIGNALNEFMKKSTNMIYMNKATCNDFFSLYGLPSILMESNNINKFLKKFRLFLMDKGTNVVYNIKDLIGYEYTDIYTLIMVKQQAFINGVPVYIKDENGNLQPKQEIVFRRTGTMDQNTSYFKFKNETREFTLDEITSGDPRWWNTPEVEDIIHNMNYTLSNSKYIQLSTHMSVEDIWWQTSILLRGLMDLKSQTKYDIITIDYNIPGVESVNVFDAVLLLVNLMNYIHRNLHGLPFKGSLYLPNDIVNGVPTCVDLLFNGLNDDGSPKELIRGLPYKLSSFNFDFDIKNTELRPDAYLSDYEYMEPDVFIPMLQKVLDQEISNAGEMLMTNVYDIYKYIRKKLYESKTIDEYRQVTDVYNKLFLVDPNRQWDANVNMGADELLCEVCNITMKELDYLKSLLWKDAEVNVITYDGGTVSPYDIMTSNVLNIQDNGVYIFRDTSIVQKIIDAIYSTNWSSPSVVSSNSINISKIYKDIIVSKIEFDVSTTSNSPTTFEALLYRHNPILGNLLRTIHSDSDSMNVLIHSIVNGLENYANSSLTALKFSALGESEYTRILKEVISYFKSYLVEFTKDEMSLLFDGLLDHGGNSNMLRLYDQIDHYKLTLRLKESLSLYDVSHAVVSDKHPDDNREMIYDDAIFRVKTTYQKLLNTGYEILYDDGSNITTQPFDIDPTDMVIANMIQTDTAYKIIISYENVGDFRIPPNYVGNVY